MGCISGGRQGMVEAKRRRHFIETVGMMRERREGGMFMKGFWRADFPKIDHQQILNRKDKRVSLMQARHNFSMASNSS